MTNVRAVGGWVLIRPDKRKTQSDVGIIIPDSVTEYGHTCGTVVDVRDEYVTRERNTLTEMPVSIGDRVLYRDYLKDLETVRVGSEEHCFIYIEDIVLVLEGTDV